MATKYIAHSSIDENGKARGGVAGDQTGREICIRTWYANWGYVLRVMNEVVRKQFANNMIDCANNNNVGYDQNNRNSLLTEALKVKFDFSKIKTPCESDCSSVVTICLLGAIYTVLGEAEYKKAYETLVVKGNCATTRTLRSRMLKLTMVSVTAYNTSDYTSSTSKAVYGDIYLKEGSHVVCYIDDGKKVNTATTNTTPKRDYLMNGDIGADVKKMQENLIYAGYSCGEWGADGEFGGDTEKALKQFQSDYKLKADGKYGTISKAKLEEVVAKKKKSVTTTTTTTTTAPTTTPTTAYYPKYTGTSSSLDAMLRDIGVPAQYCGNFKKRKPLAEANGIVNYCGTGSQNIKLKNLAKSGKLKKM